LKEERLPLLNREMIQLEQEINRIKVISCIFFQIYTVQCYLLAFFLFVRKRWRESSLQPQERGLQCA